MELSTPKFCQLKMCNSREIQNYRKPQRSSAYRGTSASPTNIDKVSINKNQILSSSYDLTWIYRELIKEELNIFEKIEFNNLCQLKMQADSGFRKTKIKISEAETAGEV